jgi:F-type H+-transporting ATPase subunit delta
MDQGRISVSYARALLEWAVEKKTAQEVYAQSESLLNLIKNNPDFSLLLHSPMVSLTKKKQVVEKLLRNFTPNLVEIVGLVVKNRREKLLVNIILVYQKLYRERFGIIRSYVETANSLGPNLKNTIKDFLGNSYKKSVELDFKVNPDIIGGFILTIEDSLLDKSVKWELEKLRKKLVGIEH